MPAVRLGQIAALVGARLLGDPELMIEGVRTLSDAGARDLSFLANPKYADQLSATSAGAVLVKDEHPSTTAAKLVVDDPYFALVRVVREWFATIPGPEGIAASARIAPAAIVHESAGIGDNVVIGGGSSIGARTIIHPGVVIGPNCTIGEDTVLYANVTIYHGTVIGARCIIHSGAVIGADGFGFATVDGVHHKLPQIGVVRIGDDVEIGANTTIDRATLGETVIGDGTKIDNLVQIAHNVRMGKHCILVSQVGIAGSTELGDYVVFGGQAGAAGHLTIGSHVQVAAQSAVMKDFEGPAKIGGSPARPLSEHLRLEASLRRLPELMKELRLRKRRGALPEHDREEG